jgi:HEAT repeat protein
MTFRPNPKSEVRNPKQIRSSKFQTRIPAFSSAFLRFRLSCLFRISRFVLRVPAVAALPLTLAVAAEPSAADLDALFKAVATFEYGQDEVPLIKAAELVRGTAANPEQRAPIEDGFISILKTGTADAKRFACRQLWMAGSDRSLDSLAALLADEAMSDAARFALERMTSPAAGKVLRAGLASARGRALIGIVDSLGHRRDKEALPLLLPLLSDRDAAVAAAAGWAAGNIGGRDAAQAIETARGKSDGALRRTLTDATLLCADRLAGDGNQRDAAVLYQRLYESEKSPAVRVAALRGLAVASPEQAAHTALGALQGEDADLRAGAAALFLELPGAAITRTLADQLPSLAPERQALVIGVLGGRGDGEALPSLRAAARSESDVVQIAALRALGDLGTGDDVPLMLGMCLNASPELSRVARDSLHRMHGPGVDEALRNFLGKADPPAAVEGLRAVAVRRVVAATPAVLQCAASQDAAVRRAALDALAALAGRNALPGLVRLMADAQEEPERKAASEALAAALERIPDKQFCADALLQGLPGATVPATCQLLGLLPAAPVPSSLEALRKSVTAVDKSVQNAAVRALAAWPDSAALEALMPIARSGDETQRTLAIRGCVRLLSLPEGRPAGETLAGYGVLLDTAERAAEKKMILAAVAGIASPGALKLVQPLMSDPELSEEARMSAVKIARAIAPSDAELSRRTLEAIAQTAGGGPATDLAKEALGGPTGK